MQIAVSLAYAAGGLPQTAPEGLVPLDSLPSPAGGTGEFVVTARLRSRKSSGNGSMTKLYPNPSSRPQAK